MKKLDRVPKTKIERATKLMKVGAKVGGNYIKYVGNRMFSSEEEAREKLNVANADSIYDGLSELKGSALKMAQMMSMDDSILPKAYVEKFSLAQFSVPPISGPLVRKVITKELGASPSQIFDTFNSDSKFAASIGQVHQGTKDGQKLAIKVQYPGVADSIGSDLQLVKPFALRMFNLKSEEVEDYFDEVKSKLYEETDYQLEMNSLKRIRQGCAGFPNLQIPKVYEEYSSKGVLTMEWMDGLHLSEFVKTEASELDRKKVAQTLWDFYLYQIHHLRRVHADPHPGNFKVSAKIELIGLDFGCMKDIPEDFYHSYFKLIEITNITNKDKFNQILTELEIFSESDSEDDRILISDVFEKLLLIINKPFQSEKFDFSDPHYFGELMTLGKELKDNKNLRKLKGSRGSKHFLYVNRTLFGLLGLMNSLHGGEIEVNNYKHYLPKKVA